MITTDKPETTTEKSNNNNEKSGTEAAGAAGPCDNNGLKLSSAEYDDEKMNENLQKFLMLQNFVNQSQQLVAKRQQQRQLRQQKQRQKSAASQQQLQQQPQQQQLPQQIPDVNANRRLRLGAVNARNSKSLIHCEQSDQFLYQLY